METGMYQKLMNLGINKNGFKCYKIAIDYLSDALQ